MGDPDRRMHVPQSVLGDDTVLALAQDQPQRWCVARISQLVIHHRAVEIHLPCVLWLELALLQIDDDEAAQAQVVEERSRQMTTTQRNILKTCLWIKLRFIGGSLSRFAGWDSRFWMVPPIH